MSDTLHRQVRQYWLVQRLESVPYANKERGFDGFFRLDYMGSAEYEFGAAGDSLRNMRSKSGVGVFKRSVKATIEGQDVVRDVYFVAAAAEVDEASDALSAWLNAPRYGRSKEQSYFDDNFAGLAQDDYKARIDAWWSFSNDVMFALESDVADKLLTALNTKRA